MKLLLSFVVGVAVCCGLSRHAVAQDVADPVAAEESPKNITKAMVPALQAQVPVVGAKDVADAPRPGQTSGVAVMEKDTEPSGLLIVPRALLFLPRWGFEVAMAPLRGFVWAYERYQLPTRTKNIFFNDAGTFGIFPVFFVETGFGANAGLRVVDRDLFGAEESFAFRLSYGGRFRQIYAAGLDSGSRLGRLKLDLKANFAIQPRDQFFGIGNGDEIDDYDPAANPLVDPSRSTTAVKTRYREDGTRFGAGAEVEFGHGFHARASTGVLLRDFDLIDADDAGGRLRVQDVYDTGALVGFANGLTTGFGELELRYDSRRNRSRYVSQAVPSEGWLLSGYASYAAGLGDDDPTDYWRLAVDLQRNINVYNNSRILILRLYGEAVVGDDDEVPFTDLARLGGRTLLRGFAVDRFRDKAATLASAEYQWELTTNLSAFMFSDAGRVWPTLHDFDSSGFRFGFGGGIQLHSMKTFLARIDVSSSTDGGLFINITFDPVYDTRARMERD